jgi:4a-hydroxytetrahydrobiopterin dehydratase
MPTSTTEQLKSKHCTPCESGVLPVPREEAKRLMAGVPGWELSPDSKLISRRWVAKDFAAGIEFFNRVAQLAEAEGHHPDLHLVGYRQVSIELWTHAIGGLSENDFIMAAKINDLPMATKSS